jgi:hypothetical protein
LARIWHGYLIFAALRLLAAAGHTGCSGILAGHRVSCCWRQGGFCVRAGCAGGVRHRSPTSLGPVRAPGLTCGFWWQVQDSNLGRLSSAILQTVAGTALTWANIRVIRHFGTHLTRWHRTNCTHSPPGSSFTGHAEVRAGRGLILRGVTRGAHTRGSPPGTASPCTRPP